MASSCESPKKPSRSNPLDVGGGGGSNSSGSLSAGSLEQHTSAPNTVVTESNVEQVSQTINNKAWEMFGKALTMVKYKTAKPSEGTIINLDGNVDGIKSGYTKVKGTMTINMSGTTVSSYTYNFTCTFYNFSDDGQLWLGGSLTYTGSTDMSDYNNIKYDITIKGGLKFNGTYEGIQELTTTYTMRGSTLSWTSNTTTTSGGKTFTYTSKYPL